MRSIGGGEAKPPAWARSRAQVSHFRVAERECPLPVGNAGCAFA